MATPLDKYCIAGNIDGDLFGGQGLNCQIKFHQISKFNDCKYVKYMYPLSSGQPKYCRTGNFRSQQIFSVFAVVVEPRNLIYT